MSKSTHIPRKSSKPGSGTDSLTTPPSGPIYLPSTASSAGDWWTSLRAASPARTSPLLDAALGLTEREAASGGRCAEPLARFDPATSLWRTCQLSLEGELSEFLETWPASGMTVAGALYPLPPLVRRTSVGAGGVWLPTPQRFDALDLPDGNREERLKKGGCSNLGQMAKQGRWPTPTRRDWKDGSFCPNVPINGLLGRAVWRTPQAGDGSHNHCDAPAHQRGTVPLMLTVQAQRSEGKSGGQLNPTWVEWLMGVPIGWVGLAPLATESYQRWLRSF